MVEDSLQEIPFEVLGVVFSWGEQAIINQVCKNFQFVVNKEKFKIPFSVVMSSIPLLQWSVGKGFPLKRRLIKASVFYGKLDVLKYLLIELKYSLPDDSCMWAASRGHLEVLRALRSGELRKACPWGAWTCESAALGGHLEILRALRSGELGGVCPWSSFACAWAAESGQLEILRVLRSGEFGGACPWNKFACELAAIEGHLEVLKVLRSGELGGVCPWNKERCLNYSRHQAIQDLINSGELDD